MIAIRFRWVFASILFLAFTSQSFADPQWGSANRASYFGFTLDAYVRGAQGDIMPGLSFRQGAYGLVGLGYSIEAGYRIRDGGMLRGNLELYFLMFGIYGGAQLQANVGDKKTSQLGVRYGIAIGPPSGMNFRIGGVTFPSSEQGSELNISLTYYLRLDR